MGTVLEFCLPHPADALISVFINVGSSAQDKREAVANVKSFRYTSLARSTIPSIFFVFLMG